MTGGEHGDGKGAFYKPTVLAQVDNAMEVAQEEIFGPVVTVIPFADEKDAVRIANDTKYGLFATVWTGDPARGHRLARQIKSGMVGHQHAVHRLPRDPVRRLQAVGLRPRARSRDARDLPRDEERARVDVAAAVQPLRAVGRSRYRWAVLAAGTAAQASFSTITLGLPAMAPALREEYDLGLQGVGLFIAAEWVGLTLSLLPWGFVTDRIGERRALAIGLTSCGVLVASMGSVRLRARRGRADARGRGGRKRPVGERPRRHAVVRAARARARVRRAPDRRAGRRRDRGTRAAAARGVVGGPGVVRLPRWVLHRDRAIGYAVVRELPSEGVQPAEVEWTLRDRRLWFLSGGKRSLRDRADGALQLPRPLPPRRARLHRGRRRRRARRVAGDRDVLPDRCRPVVGRDRLADRAAAPDRPRDDRRVRGRGDPARRVRTPSSCRCSCSRRRCRPRGTGSRSSRPPSSPAPRGAVPRSGSSRRCSRCRASSSRRSSRTLVAFSSWRTGFALAALAPLAGWVLLGRVRA